MSDPAPTPLPDLRLVVADMDGTLLDGDGQVPETLWPLLETMRQRDIAFVPASGRQHATLVRLFGRAGPDLPVIAENGTFVTLGGRELASVTLDRTTADEIVGLTHTLSAEGRDLGVVVCGKRSAYVERTDDAFLDEVRRYYVALELVDDLLAVDDEVLKIAIFDFEDAESGTAPSLGRFRETHQVVVSGKHWIDVMAAGVNKGRAVRLLQQQLGIGADQTAAFGDYLNDLEMLDEAEHSFAMANGHPEVIARARHVAPSNLDAGVVRTLRTLLGLEPPA